MILRSTAPRTGRGLRAALRLLVLALAALVNGEQFARVRHRDRNLEWSAWSDPVSFTVIGTIDGFPEITLDAGAYDAGTPIEITYEHGPANADDWVGLYAEGETPGQVPSRAWSYVSGASGAVTLSLDEAGPYFAAYFLRNGYTEVGARAHFVVGPSPVSVSTDAATYPATGTIAVDFQGGPATPGDWIGVHPAGAAPGETTVVANVPIPGTADRNVQLPAVGFAPGDHVVALFVDGSYTPVSEAATFTVLP
ncbi:MAG: hypothetical protein AAGB93_06770 [Planctomycetota bacterium]